MFGTSRKQAELFDKLLVIAGGDVGLVKEAIWAVSERGKPADLRKVIAYIQANRSRRLESRKSEYAAA